MAPFHRPGKDGSFRCSGSNRPTTQPLLSDHPPQNRHFCYGHQKESCLWPVHSLFRTTGSGRNNPSRKTLPGAIEIIPEDLARTCAELASNKKAEEIVVLDLRAISTFTDFFVIFFFQAEDGIRDLTVTGVQTCALPI